MSVCPCGTGNELDACCGRFLSGRATPTTAEQLMRARYTAHTCADMDFVRNTHHPDTVGDFEEHAARAWAKESQWLGLEILGVHGGSEKDDEATVEFIARFRDNEGTEHEHHEISLFERSDDRWWFRDAHAPRGETFRREDAKIGRNDPCHCGSGKKYKKCCG